MHACMASRLKHCQLLKQRHVVVAMPEGRGEKSAYVLYQNSSYVISIIVQPSVEAQQVAFKSGNRSIRHSYVCKQIKQ